MCSGEQKKEIYRLPDNREMIKRVLRRIQRGFDVRHKIDPDLFNETYTALNEAIDRAVETSVKWGEPDRAFISELKHSNAVFAAFKAHREQNDLARLLVDDDGNTRSFDSFRKAAAPIVGEYNVNWLQTEYTTAIRTARTAVRFRQYEKDSDLFPNGEWLPSRAAEPRMAHKVYYHTVRRLSDPWWETHYPGCVWGCQCDMRNTDKPITHVGDNPVVPGAKPTDVPPSEEAGVRSPGLSRNPARSKSLFSQDHPYFPQSCQSCSFSDGSSNLFNKEKDCLHCKAVEKKVRELVVDDDKAYTSIPTERGKLRIHQEHGKAERAENIKVASYFANKYGHEIDLLPRDDNKPCADAFNRTLGRNEEYKVNTVASASAIDRAIRSAKRQADHIVLWIESDISSEDLAAALRSRTRRCATIQTITIVRNEKDVCLTREDLLNEGLKIRLADLP